jgi:hypothetical protein
MLLKTQRDSIVLCLALALNTGAQALTVNTLAGVDAWNINHSSDSESKQRLLFLADSTPQWTYRNPSAWLRIDSPFDLSDSIGGRFKLRGDQSSDWRVDEFNVEWKISPFLGASAGVVDYKTSWCRTYDVESTWVRENDPFCTVRTTGQATGSAPGAQIYANGSAANQQIQAKFGIYNPLVLNHDSKEFNNQALLYDSRVIENKKWGFSVSSVNAVTATEWRLSYLHTHQTADNRSTPDLPKFKKPQKIGLWYAGVGFDVSKAVRARITHLNSQLDSRFTDSFSPKFDNFRQYQRRSTTAELQWNMGDSNRVGVAYSLYSAHTHDQFKRKGQNPQRFALADEEFQNISWSVSWRKDWTKNLYSAVQWTEATVNSDGRVNGRNPDVSRASGRAFGVRVGWRH